MTEHDWVTETIAAFVAGGLDHVEIERVEAHVRDCSECTTALADARAWDDKLQTLFAPVRPGPLLEDRMVQTLPLKYTARSLRKAGWKRRVLYTVAASIGFIAVGATGLTVSQFANLETLPFPGSEVALTENDLQEMLSVKSRGTEAIALNGQDMARMTYGIESESVTNTIAVNGSVQDIPRARLEGMVSAEPRLQDSTPVRLTGSDRMKRIEDNVSAVNGRTLNRLVTDGYNPAAGGLSPDDSAIPIKREPMLAFDVAQSPGGPGGFPGSPVDGHRAFPKPQQPASGFAFDPSGKDLANFSKAPVEPKPVEMDVKLLPQVVQKKDKKALGLRFGETPPANILAAADPIPVPAPAAQDQQKVIIRTGDMEFEIESFDSAVATVMKLVLPIKGGFVGTVNSEKLANGKMKGSVVVRMPPEQLDGFVLDLRKDLGKVGELKGQRIGSQDITKQYTDLESRLKAARTMETRLLNMIKEGKGEIKQLLEAEKELGVWRTRLEEYEGELRYYSNQAALSTLTIALTEKEIRAAVGLTETERVQAGIEVEDVDKALQQAIAAVTEAKGRITKSELKQLSAGQFNAILQFEVPPDASGPTRDRLRQIGRVARLEIDRVTQADGGTPVKDAKVKRGDTQFLVQIYNLANVAPRETANVQLAVIDVPAAYKLLQDAVALAKGRILTAKLDENDRQNVTAQFDFEVRRTDENAVQAAINAAGEVLARNVSRAPEGDAVTDTKVLFRTSFLSATKLAPRETTTLAVEVSDVETAATVISAQVGEVKGRPVNVLVNHERNGNVTAHLIYDVPLTSASALVEKLKAAGTVRLNQATRNPQATDGKYAIARLDVTLTNVEQIVSKDDGIWPQVRKGLTYSVSALLLSVSWLVVGLCVIVPWTIVGYGVIRLARKLFRTAAPAPTV